MAFTLSIFQEEVETVADVHPAPPSPQPSTSTAPPEEAEPPVEEEGATGGAPALSLSTLAGQVQELQERMVWFTLLIFIMLYQTHAIYSLNSICNPVIL